MYNQGQIYDKSTVKAVKIPSLAIRSWPAQCHAIFNSCTLGFTAQTYTLCLIIGFWNREGRGEVRPEPRFRDISRIDKFDWQDPVVIVEKGFRELVLNFHIKLEINNHAGDFATDSAELLCDWFLTWRWGWKCGLLKQVTGHKNGQVDCKRGMSDYFFVFLLLVFGKYFIEGQQKWVSHHLIKEDITLPGYSALSN